MRRFGSAAVGCGHRRRGSPTRGHRPPGSNASCTCRSATS
jgi:hypothetical protein